MITTTGFSKDSSIIPEGIAVTFGKEMIELKGGLLGFIRHFETHMVSENGLWLQKQKNCPKHDIIYVYIIVGNQLRYKLFYGGYETGPTTINDGKGNSFSSRTIIDWPRIVLAGPFEKCPFKRELKGFQGFRYTTKLF